MNQNKIRQDLTSLAHCPILFFIITKSGRIVFDMTTKTDPYLKIHFNYLIDFIFLYLFKMFVNILIFLFLLLFYQLGSQMHIISTKFC